MPYIANPLEGLPIRNSFVTDQANLGATPATDDTLIIYDISSTALKQLTIANLQASILVAPAFTGVPTAPTAKRSLLDPHCHQGPPSATTLLKLCSTHRLSSPDFYSSKRTQSAN